MLEIHADSRPRRIAAAHRVDEHVGIFEMRRRFAMALLPPLEARERDVVLHLESGRKIKSDLLLWANGRTGNSQQLQLDRVGLTANSRG